MTDLILTYSVHLVLVLLLQIRVQADSSLDNSVKQLLSTSRYNKDRKPDSFSYVNVQVDIYDMAKTEAKNAEFTLELYLRMWWKDARLQYSNYSSLGNVSKLEIPEVNTAQIWQPDLYFLTDRKPEIHDRSIANRIIYIYRNGSIVYSERTSLTLRSSLDLTFYPYDQQMCLVELQSFAYTNDSLILNWHDSNPVKISGAKMAEYLISVGEYGHGDKPPLEQIGIYSTLRASIMLKRTGHAHFYQLYGPSFAVVFVSWLALFLDEKKVSPRLTVHTGCVIALTTQWIGIYFLLPAVSYIRAIDIWMITHLLLVVFAFLANILSLMARRDDRKNEIDKRKDSGGCEENFLKH
ncbi:glycine receptor subunit beta-type 4-like [Mercenaria mercenaria]|uniref:glycine receptor subunit beta-type 4-like n=1 Tax=Mercenaria mercenaria TaxID=6596 RepID=UPI00234FA920|nr:glycine receptor subunit beta-type 4-like [Mercenaria mercenaria]